MKHGKIHFEGTATPEYPHTVITACGINGFRIDNCDGEFEVTQGDRYEFSNNKRQVTCGRCLRSNDFKLS